MRKISFLFLLGSFTLFIYSCQKEQGCTCQEKQSSSTEEKNSKGKSDDTHHNSSNEKNDGIRPAYSYSLDQSTAWKMKWHDEFEGNQFNQQYWTKIPRGHSPWNKYMSFNENCYEVSNGTIKLKGIVNTYGEKAEGKVPYLTGGIWTKNKIDFAEGIIEIRFKVEDLEGAWPALWLLNNDSTPWPDGGEIDIMERFNLEDYLTLSAHTDYTYNLGIENSPGNTGVSSFKHGEFNIIALEIQKDLLIWWVNGERKFEYPRVDTKHKTQFPFNDHRYFLLMDMQLENGSVKWLKNPEKLPIQMEIDWVRYFIK